MRKLVSDTLVIAELDTRRTIRPLHYYILSLLALPLPMLFLANFLVQDESAGPRLIAGSVIVSVGVSSVARLASMLHVDRFTYRLTLIRGCAVHPLSYASGMLLAGTVRSVAGAALILIFAPLFGIDIHLSVWFFPVVTLAALSLAGIALVIGTWVPSWEAGNIVSQVVGTFVGLMSPVFYPVERLPDWLEPIARLSPYTYAAQALTAILSGQGDFMGDVLILSVITVVGLTVGVAGMRWREN